MKKQIKLVTATAILAATAGVASSAMAAEAAKGGAGATYTKALITKMDVNRDGKVTKAEFMKFVEMEFDYLDKDKSGQLDTSEVMNKDYFSRPLPND